jgi:hypothetical protein
MQKDRSSRLEKDLILPESLSRPYSRACAPGAAPAERRRPARACACARACVCVCVCVRVYARVRAHACAEKWCWLMPWLIRPSSIQDLIDMADVQDLLCVPERPGRPDLLGLPDLAYLSHPPWVSNIFGPLAFFNAALSARPPIALGHVVSIGAVSSTRHVQRCLYRSGAGGSGGVY